MIRGEARRMCMHVGYRWECLYVTLVDMVVTAVMDTFGPVVRHEACV